MLKVITLLSLLVIAGCGDSVDPVPVAPKAQKAYEKNATDAVGVADGYEQVSPFGKPAH